MVRPCILEWGEAESIISSQYAQMRVLKKSISNQLKWILISVWDESEPHSVKAGSCVMGLLTLHKGSRQENNFDGMNMVGVSVGPTARWPPRVRRPPNARRTKEEDSICRRKRFGKGTRDCCLKRWRSGLRVCIPVVPSCGCFLVILAACFPTQALVSADIADRVLETSETRATTASVNIGSSPSKSLGSLRLSTITFSWEA